MSFGRPKFPEKALGVVPLTPPAPLRGAALTTGLAFCAKTALWANSAAGNLGQWKSDFSKSGVISDLRAYLAFEA